MALSKRFSCSVLHKRCRPQSTSTYILAFRVVGYVQHLATTRDSLRGHVDRNVHAQSVGHVDQTVQAKIVDLSF